MAVEICCLRADGNAGRARGAIIDIRECGESESVRWGRLQNPKTDGGRRTFFIVRIANVGLATIDAKIRAYGGHKSRILINPSFLPVAAQADINSNEIPTISSLQLSPALDDQGTSWDTAVVGP